MENVVSPLITVLLGGGPQAILALLAIVCLALYVDRNKALKSRDRMEDRLDKMNQDMMNGNRTIVSSLTDLRMALWGRYPSSSGDD